jgi:putative ATPase
MVKRKVRTTQDEPGLFEASASGNPANAGSAPLADRVRPRSLAELVGQPHIVGDATLLTRAIAQDRVPSMILWGPPGSGKTTIARLMADNPAAAGPGPRSRFVPFSAVLGGVSELRVIVEEAKHARDFEGVRTTLFIDEIHRFNKAQQDALLPHVEHGTVTLIGATTENPSFAVNAALLSRCKVFHLQPLEDRDIVTLLRRALDDERGLASYALAAEDATLEAIAKAAQGDARRALSTLEMTADYVRAANKPFLTIDDVGAASEEATLLYDKRGEEHYNVTSAFIKSMRGSDPDAAIYWLMRMIEAGDDPLFVLRRMIIFASEDIGNADPRALQVAVAADQAFQRVGMPEGIFPLAHACLYLACAPKSDGVKTGISQAREAIKVHGALPVPKKLRNAVSRLMRDEGYGQGYLYAHDFDGHVVPGESYLPDDLTGKRFYRPTDEGLEKAIKDRLERLRAALAAGMARTPKR